ncbi:unnamed protein product [Allacma fusca]|uniref:Uncharacterized protein n=1 Tax=Allacma fusca TaxID=39272 RepID=A0A8J2KFK6_9HEXA|nr:unnamed protein product [Allacma fusca]
MACREKLLLDDNPVMLAGMYVDPMFCSTTSGHQIKIARDTVLNVADRLESLQQQEREEIRSSSGIQSEIEDNNELDFFRRLK